MARRGRKEATLPTVDEVLRAHVHMILDVCRGNQTNAARVLGIDRKTLARHLQRWNIGSAPEARTLQHGSLIAVEGIDGAGLTTQTQKLVSYLEARGHRAVATCEPSNGPIGKPIRELLLDPPALASTGAMRTFSLLFAADRSDHINRVVAPALARGMTVVSDRWYHSSLAYQRTGVDPAGIATPRATVQRTYAELCPIPELACARWLVSRGRRSARITVRTCVRSRSCLRACLSAAMPIARLPLIRTILDRVSTRSGADHLRRRARREGVAHPGADRAVQGPGGGDAAPYSDAKFLRDDRYLYIALYAADEDIRASDEFTVQLGTGARRRTLHFTAGGKLSPAIEGAQLAVDRDGSLDDPHDDDEEWVIEAALPLAALPFSRDATLPLAISRCDVTRDRTTRCGTWTGELARR